MVSWFFRSLQLKRVQPHIGCGLLQRSMAMLLALLGLLLALQAPVMAAVAAPLIAPPLAPSKRQHLNHLYSFDATPLNGRTPVVIVPGRAQEGQGNPWWKKLGKALPKQSALEAHYKFYLFLYDSTQSLEHLSLEFTQDLSFLQQYQQEEKPSVVVGYSMGGLIVRDALLQHPSLMQRIAYIVGMAVPFHGSPMFEPPWFESTMRHVVPVREFLDKLTYQYYIFNKPNLLQSMPWVNFDHSMPSVVPSPKRTLLLWHGAPQPLRAPTPPPYGDQQAALAQFRRKLIVYASYLENKETHPPKPSLLKRASSTVLATTEAVLGTFAPYHGVTVHGVMNYTNRQLANAPTYEPNDPQRPANNHLYRYNDGVIPLSSMLYLPERATPYGEDLQGLKRVSTACFARVFKNLDHVDMGHYRWPEFPLKAVDAFHPSEGKRKPMQWLFYDLEQLAKAAATRTSPCGL
jgi:pimeloyl-ACP methyl ester carboxylesterase